MMTRYNISDQDLLLLLRDSDSKAFDAIYKRYWSELLEKALVLMREKEAAQDIVQEVFLTVWKRRESLKIDHLRAYLHSAVRFSSYRKLSKASRNTPFYSELENVLHSSVFAEENLLGCMSESSCAISAAGQLTAMADWIDLDGNLDASNDPFAGSQVVDGLLIPSKLPGLGFKEKVQDFFSNL